MPRKSARPRLGSAWKECDDRLVMPAWAPYRMWWHLGCALAIPLKNSAPQVWPVGLLFCSQDSVLTVFKVTLNRQLLWTMSSPYVNSNFTATMQYEYKRCHFQIRELRLAEVSGLA